jgi:hypothetical protein
VTTKVAAAALVGAAEDTTFHALLSAVGFASVAYLGVSAALFNRDIRRVHARLVQRRALRHS